jgi:hypothetical protein
MQCHHHGYLVELADDWWDEADMKNFVPKAICYKASHVRPNGQPIVIIALSDVADVGPERRKIGIFRDSSDGVRAQKRVTDILRGFRLNETLPPVVVRQNELDSSQRYRLHDGAHRFYLSLIAGFTHIPAVVLLD